MVKLSKKNIITCDEKVCLRDAWLLKLVDPELTLGLLEDASIVRRKLTSGLMLLAANSTRVPTIDNSINNEQINSIPPALPVMSSDDFTESLGNAIFLIIDDSEASLLDLACSGCEVSCSGLEYKFNSSVKPDVKFWFIIVQ